MPTILDALEAGVLAWRVAQEKYVGKKDGDYELNR